MRETGAPALAAYAMSAIGVIAEITANDTALLTTLPEQLNYTCSTLNCASCYNASGFVLFSFKW